MNTFVFKSISQNLLINEVVSVNGSTLPQIGEYYDWVEIKNTTSNSINISEYYITDDPTKPTKYKLPNSTSLIIPANGFIVLFASSNVILGAKHLSFSLSSDGEEVRLYDPTGSILIDSIIFPKLKTDVSYGKLSDGTAKFFLPASPNQTNNIANSYLGIVDSPVFSQLGGIFSSPLSLSLSSTDGSSIIYSVDGTNPNPENISIRSYQYKNTYSFFPGQPLGQFNTQTYQAFNYTTPINIVNRTSENNKTSTKTTGIHFIAPNYKVFKGTVVKARATKTNYISSDVVEQSYFINETGQNPYQLPIVSLGIQENKLFDFYSGTYVPGEELDKYRIQYPNGTDWGSYGVGNYYRDVEMEGTFNFIPDKNTVISQNIGLKIHGNITRHLILKSLRLYARSSYGKDSFEYKFFDYQPTTIFKRLILRNSGMDFNATMFRDGVIQKSVSHLNFETQSYTPAVSFINGEFWGILNIRERLDDEYYNLKYGVPKDSMDILENTYQIKLGEDDHYIETLNYVKNNNLSSVNNFNEVKRRLDVDNMIDYYTTELYFNNQDWPNNNMQYWRMSRPYDATQPKGKDGRWRWSLFDIDTSTGAPDDGSAYPSVNNISTFFGMADDNVKIFTKLFDNQTFKNSFLIRNADLLNTTFKADRMAKLIYDHKIKLNNVIYDHVKRWREPLQNNWTDPVDTLFWSAQVKIMSDYVKNRPAFYRSFIRSKFGIAGEFQLTLVNDITKGHIKVNTIEIEPNTPGVAANPYPWVGNYFDNLATVLVAIPKRGYKFSHWLLNGVINNNPTLSFTTSTNTSVEAVYNIYFLSENPFPLPYNLSSCEYNFTNWPSNSPLGSFPISSSFVYFDQLDPTLTAEIENKTSGAYNLGSRTRVIGLGANGVSFVNTSNAAGNTGYPGMKLGGMILAINTENINKVGIKWTGRTIAAASKEYKIRLQYRYGDIWPFQDLLDENGQIIEYARQANGQNQSFSLENLPASILGKDYVQLMWRYYFTGNTTSQSSDARDQLAIDDIVIKTEKIIPTTFQGNVIGPSVIKSVELLPQSAQKIYSAKEFIELLPTFDTEPLVELDANIGGCPN